MCVRAGPSTRMGGGVGGNWDNLPHLVKDPRWGPGYIIKRSKYFNRTVTLIQQSGRYLVDIYTADIVLTFNLRGLILKISFNQTVPV